VSHIWKYWVLLTPAFQKIEMSGSLSMSYANDTPLACNAATVVSMKVAQLVQLPLSQGYTVLAGWPPLSP
jgi:hypothetical protein